MTFEHPTSRLILLVVVVLCSTSVSHSQDSQNDQPRELSLDSFNVLQGHARGPLGRDIHLLVTPGNQASAIAYYLRIEADDELGLNLLDESGQRQGTIDDLLVYLGYRDTQDIDGGKGVTADRIERFGSEDLVDFERMKTAVSADGGDANAVKSFAAGDIESTRYFSPKITDVAKEPEFFRYGWRKLVRLKALAGSAAKTKGVLSGYLLFNVFASEAEMQVRSPFDAQTPEQRSQQNQAILVRNPDAPVELDDPIYWIVFGVLPDGLLGFSLNASFDYRHPATVPENSAYFVPDACADCHGGIDLATGKPDFARAKLNYLDTDHFFDRVFGIPPAGFVDDFGAIAATDHGVIFDGGKDQSSPEFATAFRRIVNINTDIFAQNQQVDPGIDTFQSKAVQKWIQLHDAANFRHVGLLEDRDGDGFLDRSIEGKSGQVGAEDRWRKNDRIDEALIPLLNRYCYRCHSSLRYSIYDRSHVRLTSNGSNGVMQLYLTQPLPPEFVPFMPQDRAMPSGDRARIVDLINRLIDE